MASGLISFGSPHVRCTPHGESAWCTERNQRKHHLAVILPLGCNVQADTVRAAPGGVRLPLAAGELAVGGARAWRGSQRKGVTASQSVADERRSHCWVAMRLSDVFEQRVDVSTPPHSQSTRAHTHTRARVWRNLVRARHKPYSDNAVAWGGWLDAHRSRDEPNWLRSLPHAKSVCWMHASTRRVLVRGRASGRPGRFYQHDRRC